MNTADRIQQLRKAKGISQEELADKIGVSRQAVSKWESEQTTPDVEKVLLLSEGHRACAQGNVPSQGETRRSDILHSGNGVQLYGADSGCYGLARRADCHRYGHWDDSVCAGMYGLWNRDDGIGSNHKGLGKPILLERQHLGAVFPPHVPGVQYSCGRLLRRALSHSGGFHGFLWTVLDCVYRKLYRR